MKTRPIVSIVIPTYNSEKTLTCCLDSIQNQSYCNVELIIVDEFSRDRTVEIARNYTERVFVSRVKGMSAQKNVAVNMASGEFICFIDSDMELTPTVIEECVHLIDADDRIGGIVIPERSVGESFWVNVRDFERSFYTGTAIESARFFRRDLVRLVGGFDDGQVFCEDSVLPQKIEERGYSVDARIAANILHHEDDFSLLKHLRKRYNYGKTTRDYAKKYESYFKKHYGVGYRFKLFITDDRFARQPLLGLSVLVLKALELTFNELGAFSARIRIKGTR